jgi:AcrR family transcriptional regulator
MKQPTSSKRKYDSTRRQAQANETRRQILEAGRKLFMERGYAGATIEAIATEAKVAPETVYAVFRNKKRILINLMNVSSPSGVEDHTPMLERAGPRAVSQEHDQRRQLQMFAQDVAKNLEQVAPVSEILVNAAKTEQDVDRILQRLLNQRVEHMKFAVQQIASNGPFREKVEESYATDIVWSLTSPEVFLLLTRDRGWPKEKYAQWLADTLTRVLLPEPK